MTCPGTTGVISFVAFIYVGVIYTASFGAVLAFIASFDAVLAAAFVAIIFFVAFLTTASFGAILTVAVLAFVAILTTASSAAADELDVIYAAVEEAL